VPDASVLTAADIARLAGVTRATVSNWRRRHADFPEPSGGTDASPAYDRSEVEAWLTARGALPELPPAERLWRDVMEMADDANLGDAVQRAAELVQAFPVPAVDHMTAAPFPPAKNGFNHDRVARDLEDAVATYGSRDVIGMLTSKYIEATGRQASTTPKPVADLMAELVVSAGAVVLDPACGTGELLASAADRGASRVIGQEIEKGLARLADVLLGITAGSSVTHVQVGDSLRDDRLAGSQADAVLCHPPFGERDWGHEELAYDLRWEYGTPPRAESELAWAQHALAHLRPGGWAVMVMPPAAASRPSGRRIRAEMLRRGAIRAIASLPPGAARPRNIGLHLWVLQRPVKEISADPRTLFVHIPADADDDADSRRSAARWQHASSVILRAWNSFTTSGHGDEPGAWRAVSVMDLLDENIDLTPARHVGAWLSARSPADIAAAADAERDGLRSVLAGLADALPGGDWTPYPTPKWRMVSIGDLARSAAVSVHRASTAGPADDELVDDIDPDDGWPVLTVSDVVSGEPPSASAPGGVIEPGWVKIRAGDVIIPATAGAYPIARVAAGADGEAILGRGLHLIRAEPGRIDPWFLSGFLASPANIQQASYGSTVTRIDVRRLAVPLLPPSEQRRYGLAFRQLHGFRVSSEEFASQSRTLARLLCRALADGGLQPAPDSHEQPGKPDEHASRLDRDDMSQNGKKRP
jgi:SAM-dependent methyltransferase/predicted DNA-binding transcriptional regulator AlpA